MTTSLNVPGTYFGTYVLAVLYSLAGVGTLAHLTMDLAFAHNGHVGSRETRGPAAPLAEDADAASGKGDDRSGTDGSAESEGDPDENPAKFGLKFC